MVVPLYQVRFCFVFLFFRENFFEDDDTYSWLYAAVSALIAQSLLPSSTHKDDPTYQAMYAGRYQSPHEEVRCSWVVVGVIVWRV
jgi:hypothetical protein